MLARAAAMLAAGLAPLPLAAAERAVAIFPFELIDSSQEGADGAVRADETRRLALISSELAEAFRRHPNYRLSDLAPHAAAIAAAQPLNRCNGCEADLAAQAGADLAVSGTVQKVSNLILNINVYLREVRGSGPVRAMSVDIRGNTDESWLRGIRYILRNRLFSDAAP